MIGLIPRIWVQMLQDKAVPAQIQAIFLKAGVPPDRKFALDEPYDDAELLRLVHASAKILGREVDSLIDDFSQAFIEDAVRRWPVWFEMAPDARSFLERQPRIHGSFSRSLDDAEHLGKQKAQKFRTTEMPDGLLVEYRSPNKLCGMYKSLAAAVFHHYKDTTGRIEESRCMHDGHDHCEIRVRWPR